MPRVCVKVWLPRPHYISDGLRSDGKTPFGHVSLGTYDENNLPVEYISFWPEDPVVGVHSPRNAGVCQDYEYDLRKLPRLNYTLTEINFATLDTGRVNEAIVSFKTSGCNWSIFGSADFMAGGVETQNCSSLVLHLLATGGIGRISRVEDLLAGAVRDGAYYGGWLSLLYSIPGSYFVVGMAARAAVLLNPRFISMRNRISPGLAAMNKAMGLGGAAVDPNSFSNLFRAGSFARLVHGISSRITPLGLAGSAFLAAVGAGIVFSSATSAARARMIPSPTDLVRFLENASLQEREMIENETANHV